MDKIIIRVNDDCEEMTYDWVFSHTTLLKTQLLLTNKENYYGKQYNIDYRLINGKIYKKFGKVFNKEKYVESTIENNNTVLSIDDDNLSVNVWEELRYVTNKEEYVIIMINNSAVLYAPVLNYCGAPINNENEVYFVFYRTSNRIYMVVSDIKSLSFFEFPDKMIPFDDWMESDKDHYEITTVGEKFVIILDNMVDIIKTNYTVAINDKYIELEESVRKEVNSFERARELKATCNIGYDEHRNIFTEIQKLIMNESLWSNYSLNYN